MTMDSNHLLIGAYFISDQRHSLLSFYVLNIAVLLEHTDLPRLPGLHKAALQMFAVTWNPNCDV
jgi:hypothetical protein